MALPRVARRQLDEGERQVAQHERAVPLADAGGHVGAVDEDVEQLVHVAAGRAGAPGAGLRWATGGVGRCRGGGARDGDLEARRSGGDDDFEAHSNRARTNPRNGGAQWTYFSAGCSDLDFARSGC